MGRGTSGAVLAPTYDGAGSPADSDQQLVARIRRGDDRAFEVLYQRYHRRIQAYVLGMVKDHGRAEDVTQEVFVSALRRMRETEQPLAFKPWLYQIAKNGCIDAFRRSKRAEEVSYDADDGLAPADHSRLVGSGPSPDAAVAAKQDLESLCGAFGGLSETHHEILVLRELEGLSYQEIGRRMGMSRPAVESTLFRARRRLTEEYDDIVSGARCLRIQGIITMAAQSRLGTRDTRRLARHLAHCQPCRREALAAGLDRNIFARPTVRERVATKVAGMLPFPIFLRMRRGGADASAAAPPSGRAATFMSNLPLLSDQLSSGWGKAAAGAAVLVAGVGAGVGVQQQRSSGAAPAAIHSTSAQPVSARTAATPAARLATPTPTAASSTPTERADASRRTKSSPSRRKPGSEKSSAADRATSAGGGSTPTQSAGPSGGSNSKASSGKSSGGSPSLAVPISGSSGGGAAKDAVTQTTTNAVQNTADAVKETTNTVRETTHEVTAGVDEAANQVTGGGTVGETVDKVTDGVDDSVNQITGGLDDTVDQVTGGVNGIVGGGG